MHKRLREHPRRRAPSARPRLTRSLAREPIFPPELKRRVHKRLTLPGAIATWHRPTTLAWAARAQKRSTPDARLVCGNTEVGVEVKFKNMKYPSSSADARLS